MTPAARIAGAIAVLDDLIVRRRPAADALKDWGLAHRFAGSGDRAAIASLVYDALRRRSSASWIMGEETPRAIMLGALALVRGLGADDIADLCTGHKHAPAALTEEEHRRLASCDLTGAPEHVQADVPEWLYPHLHASFGDETLKECLALAQRAPLDLRVNTLKALRPNVMEALMHLSPAVTPLSPHGIRIPHGPDGRGPSVQSDPAFLKGLFEIQDEGSQLAGLLTGAQAGQQVLDLCAGAGGKTLQLAAMMNNQGQLYATDIDTRRLKPLYERLERAGVRNVQVRSPRGSTQDHLKDLAGRMDLVIVDAPCTGIGTWRRNPDAKWRIRPGALQQRLKEQAALLDQAAGFVRSGGRLAYITCSVLAVENYGQNESFQRRNPEFKNLSPDRLTQNIPSEPSDSFGQHCLMKDTGIQFSSGKTGTDGFFISVLQRG